MDAGDAKLRVSNAERAHVSQLLERAVGEGMLTVDESVSESTGRWLPVPAAN